jgi:hypothetical protein
LIKYILITFTLLTFVGSTLAQQIDTTAAKPVAKPLEDNRPKKATLYALIPGGGQIYNKSYWKVPVIYVGYGVLVYSYMFYSNEYNLVREAYKQTINGETVTNPDYANVPEDMLYNLRESYRKNRDLSAIGIAGWYALGIIDAAVEAHLKEFDVGDNLSLKVKPSYQIAQTGVPNFGVKIQARF